MNVQIEKQTQNEFSKYLLASCDGVSASVLVYADRVQVVCHNASNKVWRGAGRFFPTIEAAVNGYKSAPMKAIILAAQ